MSAGLFTVTCPECGKELLVDQSGVGTCTTCDHTYLNRFGCLIPLEVDVIAVSTSGSSHVPKNADASPQTFVVAGGASR